MNGAVDDRGVEARLDGWKSGIAALTPTYGLDRAAAR